MKWKIIYILIIIIIQSCYIKKMERLSQTINSSHFEMFRNTTMIGLRPFHKVISYKSDTLTFNSISFYGGFKNDSLFLRYLPPDTLFYPEAIPLDSISVNKYLTFVRPLLIICNDNKILWVKNNNQINFSIGVKKGVLYFNNDDTTEVINGERINIDSNSFFVKYNPW